MAPSEARVSPFDRGFVFADGMYEVLRVTRLGAGRGVGAGGGGGGPARLAALGRHEARMTRSLAALGIAWDVRDPAMGLAAIGRRLVEASGLDEALIYVQVTRGTPDLSIPPLRSHVPPRGLRPTVFAFIRGLPALKADAPLASKACWTVTDQRWLRCDIKSIALLGNVMASMDAQGRHDDPSAATEAILLRDTTDGRRLVSEGSLTNLAIVTREGRLLTPDARSVSLLPGITREILLEHEASNPQGLRTGDITEADLRAAREVMLLGTTASVTRVTHIDGRAVGGAEAGARVSESHAARLGRLLMGLVAAGAEDGGGDKGPNC